MVSKTADVLVVSLLPGLIVTACRLFIPDEVSER